MKTMNSSYAKNNFGELMEMVSKDPVVIKRYGKEYAVFISMKDYYLLKDRFNNIEQQLKEIAFGEIK